jgi:hypothetical protein
VLTREYLSAPAAPSTVIASSAAAGSAEQSSAQAEAVAPSTGIATAAMALLPDLFSKFATEVESKDKRRRKTLTMGQAQFKKVLEHLKLLPDRVSQSEASELFTQAVEPGKIQLKEEAFKAAMVKLLATIQAKQETTLPVIPGALAEQAGGSMASTAKTNVSQRTKESAGGTTKGKAPRNSGITKEVRGKHAVKVQQNANSLGGLQASDSTRDAEAFAAAATASVAAEKQRIKMEEQRAQEKARTDRFHAAGAEGNAAVEGQSSVANVCRFVLSDRLIGLVTTYSVGCGHRFSRDEKAGGR